MSPQSVKTCKHGHERIPENVYTAPNGQDICRVCRRNADAKRVRNREDYENGKLAQLAKSRARAGSGVITPLSYRHQLARDILAGKR